MGLKTKGQTENRHHGFPVVIGISVAVPKLNERAIDHIRTVLSKIRERWSAGVLVVTFEDSHAAEIRRAAERAGTMFRSLNSLDRGGIEPKAQTEPAPEDIEFAEATDLLL